MLGLLGPFRPRLMSFAGEAFGEAVQGGNRRVAMGTKRA